MINEKELEKYAVNIGYNWQREQTFTDSGTVQNYIRSEIERAAVSGAKWRNDQGDDLHEAFVKDHRKWTNHDLSNPNSMAHFCDVCTFLESYRKAKL